MSIRRRRLVPILALVGHGSASDQMRYTANRVAARVPDVYQKQVMENLARTAANPGSMPYLSRLFNGTASATDTATGVVSLTGEPHWFTSVDYGLSSISRDVQSNIGLDPIDNPDKLAAMHVAYQLIVAPQTVDPVTHTTCLGPFLVNTNHCVASLPPPGWLRRGDKPDLPRTASAIAHCGPTYVWVMPQDLASLTQFTYFILYIATASPGGRSAATGESPDHHFGLPAIPEREPTPRLNFDLMLVPRP